MLDEAVHLESYQAAWGMLFRLEQARLAAALSPPPVAWTRSLERLGYEALGEAGVAGRLYVRRRAGQACNVHLVQLGGPHRVSNLALRDYLRASPEAARRYEAARRAAIAAGTTTLQAYSKAKGAILSTLLGEALGGRTKGPGAAG